MLPKLSAAALIVFSTYAAPAVAAESTSSVLARMDREAGSFRDMTAAVHKVTYTSALDDSSRESGTVWMKKDPSSVLMRTEIAGQDPRSVAVQGNTAQIYYPKIRTVQIYDLGKNREMVEQFLMLGWGSSSHDLQKNYTIRVAGEETIAGQKAIRLELVPKSRKALEQVQRVDLWLPVSGGHPIQQKILQPGGDYYLISYSDIKLNTNVPAEALNLKIPQDAKKQYPQK
jgi:outer membrane lipoprotein-sorting protein